MIATMVIPGGVVTGLFLLPLARKVLPRRLAHFVACSFVLTVAGVAGYLTYQALAKDAHSAAFRQGPGQGRRGRRAGRSPWPTRDGHPARGLGLRPGPRPAHPGRRPLRQEVPGLPQPRRPEGRRAQSAPDLKDYGSLRLGPRPPGEARLARLLRQGPPVRRDEEWKEGSKLTPKELDDVAAYVATLRDDPARRHPRRVGRRPQGQGPPRPRALPEGVRRVPHDGRLVDPRQEAPARPRPLRLGLGPLDRADDQAPGVGQPLRLPRGRAEDARPSATSSPTPTSPPWSATSRATITGPRPPARAAAGSIAEGPAERADFVTPASRLNERQNHHEKRPRNRRFFLELAGVAPLDSTYLRGDVRRDPRAMQARFGSRSPNRVLATNPGLPPGPRRPRHGHAGTGDPVGVPPAVSRTRQRCRRALIWPPPHGELRPRAPMTGHSRGGQRTDFADANARKGSQP